MRRDTRSRSLGLPGLVAILAVTSGIDGIVLAQGLSPMPKAPSAAQGPASQPAAAGSAATPPAAVPVPTLEAGEPAALVAETTAAKVSSKDAWYDKFELMGFIDAYYSVNYNFPKPDKNQVVRAFDQDNGFALSWVGLDIAYPAEPVGGKVALRMGPTAGRFALRDAADGSTDFGLEYLKEAFVTWRPFSRLTLDFGKFGTIYGAEVAESWLNYNYTRGVLNWGGQPFHHTGLRAGIDLGSGLSATVLAVNGWDTTLDNNTMKTFGAQLGYASDVFSVLVGYLGGPEQDDTQTVQSTDGTGERQWDDQGNPLLVTTPVDGANSRWRHFIDLVATLTPTDSLGLIFNADYGFEDVGNDTTISWYGASLAAQYQFTKAFAAALRGEYFGDPDGARFGTDYLITGTLTLDFAPAKFLLFRLDNRIDVAKDGIFINGDGVADEKTQFTTTLGVVVHSG